MRTVFPYLLLLPHRGTFALFFKFRKALLAVFPVFCLFVFFFSPLLFSFFLVLFLTEQGKGAADELKWSWYSMSPAISWPAVGKELCPCLLKLGCLYNLIISLISGSDLWAIASCRRRPLCMRAKHVQHVTGNSVSDEMEAWRAPLVKTCVGTFYLLILIFVSSANQSLCCIFHDVTTYLNDWTI